MARPINPAKEPFSEERKQKISEAMKRKWKDKDFRDKVTESIKSFGTPEQFKASWGKSGSDNPNWKGGITSKAQLIRKSRKYISWRKSVLTRDGYTCQECEQIGGELNAHHLVPFSSILKEDNQELLWDIDNGLTLCIECHKKTDSYSKC